MNEEEVEAVRVRGMVVHVLKFRKRDVILWESNPLAHIALEGFIVSALEPPHISVPGAEVMVARIAVRKVGITKVLLHFLNLIKCSVWASLNPLVHES